MTCSQHLKASSLCGHNLAKQQQRQYQQRLQIACSFDTDFQHKSQTTRLNYTVGSARLTDDMASRHGSVDTRSKATTSNANAFAHALANVQMVPTWPGGDRPWKRSNSRLSEQSVI